MFRRILIANRGEVAVRVARTCRELGVQTVVVASDADLDQAWLAGADIVVGLGPARASESYLDQDALIEVALHHGCSAVHPGWGFLAENALFAARCGAAGLTFIGPEPHHLEIMGDKAQARATMAALGMPVIPGTDPLDGVERARSAAAEMGYPVLLKAVAGGGGRGMRAVREESELASAYQQATAEALASFGDGRMYLEKLIEGGRHVEVQVVADRYGRCHALGERECSLQRRHQKVLEEAPSPGLSDEERARVLPLVADVVGRAGYRNAGTVEMLLDRDGKLWFMEMNTRLQVEHPVTEEITGIDLVAWQLAVAANERLPEAPPSRGHSIECRINAEDPDDGFRPSPGRITRLSFPEGVRVDTHLSTGDRIPPNYDSMIAKVISRGDARAEAISKLEEALASTVIEGVTTNLSLHRRILAWENFRQGRYDVTSLERALAEGL